MKRQPDDFEACLRQDADADRPTFDGALHARVMSSLGRADAPSVDAPSRLRIWIPTGLAAALLVAAGVWWMQQHEPKTMIVVSNPPVQQQAFTLPDYKLAQRVSEWQRQFDELHDEPLAALNQDTRRFTKFLSGQLDVLPDHARAQ
jgi:hypothetical protein